MKKFNNINRSSINNFSNKLMSETINEYANLDTLVQDDYYKINKSELECPICFNLIINPYQCKNCQSPLCGTCNSQLKKCPICAKKDSYIKSVMLFKLICKLSFKCLKCNKAILFDNIHEHYKQKCKSSRRNSSSSSKNQKYKSKYLLALEKVQLLKSKNSKLENEYKNLYRKFYSSERESTKAIHELKKQNYLLINSYANMRLNSNNDNSNSNLYYKCKLHQHFLKFENANYEPFYCDICKRKLNNNLLIFRCSDCQFDLCPTCTEMERVEGKIMISSPFHPSPCSLEVIPVEENKNICNICKKRVSNKFFYRCHKCDYDICSSCINTYPINNLNNN